MAVGSLIAYETYTGHFRLNRIERSVKLLKDLTALSPDIQKSGNNEITKIFEGLTDSLNTYVNHRLTPFSFPSWLLKAIACAMPWVLISLFIILSNTDGTRNAISGIVIMAVPVTIIGSILPDFKYPLLNYIVYPIGSTSILILVIMLWYKFKKKSSQ